MIIPNILYVIYSYTFMTDNYCLHRIHSLDPDSDRNSGDPFKSIPHTENVYLNTQTYTHKHEHRHRNRFLYKHLMTI